MKFPCIKFLLFLFIYWGLAKSITLGQNGTYDITAFGAVKNSKQVCTKAIQEAIDAFNAAGGGEVVALEGVFVTGTVHLKSNVNVYLQAGAILKGSTNLVDYETNVPGKPYSQVYKGMLFTEDAENVSISGQGQIDGNGDSFFLIPKSQKDLILLQ